MTKPATRKFSVLDGMILVAVTALGMAWWQYLPPQLFNNEHLSSLFDGASTFRADSARVLALAFDLYPLMVTWALGFILVRLRHPRPPLRRIARQPGFVASCATVVAVIVKTIENMRYISIQPYNTKTFIPLMQRWGWNLLFNDGIGCSDTLHPIVAAVVTVWTILILGRIARSEHSWIDRGGIVLGSLWMLLYAIELWVMEEF